MGGAGFGGCEHDCRGLGAESESARFGGMNFPAVQLNFDSLQA